MILAVAVMLLLFTQSASLAPIKSYFIAADGCTLPCQLGIELGITTGPEAAQIWLNNKWIIVDSLNPSPWYSQGKYELVLKTYYVWYWSGYQPTWIKDYFITDRDWGDGSPVLRNLQISTSLTIGDTLLLLGLPEGGNVLLKSIYQQNAELKACPDAFYDAIYDSGKLHIRADIQYPLSIISFLQTPVDIEFEPRPAEYRHTVDFINESPCTELLP